MYLWSLVAVTHLRYSILTDKFVEFRLLADFLMIEMSVLWMNMQIVNMNVYRHRYWNLCSLLPLSVTHHHTAFLIFPDAPTVQLFKTPKGLGSNWREFYGDPTFLASWTSTYQRLLLQDNFSILQFFFPKSTSTYPPLHVWKHCKDPWNPPNKSKQIFIIFPRGFDACGLSRSCDLFGALDRKRRTSGSGGDNLW